MDYTNSSNHLTHSTGQRLHTNLYSPTTRVTDNDINGPAFEILAVIEAAGITPMPFDVEVPASYSQLLSAIQQLVSASVPAGFPFFFAGASVPPGWLVSDGAAVSRVAYAKLFAAIGTTYGAGDGSTTFNLPDLRSEFLRGLDAGRGVDAGRVLGSMQGDAIRNITGSLTAGSSVDTQFVDSMQAVGAFAVIPGNKGFTQDISGAAGQASGASFDASRVVPTAAENRPRNIAMTACIKY